MIIDLSNINSIKNRAGTSFSSVRTRLGDTIWPLNVTQHVCYDVVSSISYYQGTQTWVYDKAMAKWYVKNSSNDYEEYGQYASSSSNPGYEGKLGIWNQHEWKYTGSQWTDLGELEGTTTTITGPEYIERKSGYLGTFNLGRPFKTNTRIQVKVNKTHDGGDGGIICDYGVQGNWNDNNDWRVFWASGRLYYDYEAGRVYVTTTGSEFEFEIGNYYVKNLSTNSNIINTTAKSAGRTNPMQISSSTDFMKYYYLKVYEGDELVMDLVPYKDTNNAYGFFDLVAKQALMPTGTVYGGGTETSYSYGDFEYLEEYDEMEAPEFTVTVSSMSELLARECVFVGQKAIVNGVNYKYTDNLEWEEIAENPLTFTFSGSGTWQVYKRATTTKYSLNGADPVTLSGSTISAITTVNVSQGDTIQVWSNIKDAAASDTNYTWFGGTAPCTLSGNIMSMDREEDYLELTEISRNYEFYNMFKNYTGITDVSQLQLPATTLTTSCYNSMFQGCTSLTSAPSLPATTLAASCYNSMFSGCTGLTSAPALPATTLANYCYRFMFSGCTGLTSAPALPATTLASSCYQFMFNGCTGLTSAPSELPATTVEQQEAYYCMFYGCTSLTSAPYIKATLIWHATNALREMFSGCTSLNYIHVATMPPAVLSSNWVLNVAASGTFICDDTTYTPVYSDSQVPTGWTYTNIAA